MVFDSPLQIIEHIANTYPFHAFEIWLALCAITLFFERVSKGNYRIKTSYFWGPLLLMTFALVLSYIRGSVITQQFSVVYEIHESIMLPVSFFVLMNLFSDPGEWRVLLVILIFGGIGKAADGAGIYFFSHNERKDWGVVQLWRDGFLLAIGVISTVLILHYKGHALRWLKRTLLICSPLLLFTLIVSYRRTFFLACFISLISLFFLLPKGKRPKQGLIFLGIMVALGFVILSIDPIGFITRMSGALDPKAEGSAYIRVMELPNVLLNIYHNPIFGTPIGVKWHQYFRMPLFAVYTEFGCHNTYLYWPLRTGIIGTVAFWWFLGRQWKAVLIQRALINKTEEQQFFSQFTIQLMIIYQFACAFGLLYADGFIINVFLMAALQLMLEAELGIKSLSNVRLFATLREKKLVYKIPKNRKPKPTKSEIISPAQ